MICKFENTRTNTKLDDFLMNKTILKWKKKVCDDNSGSWIEADVKVLSWTYVVDQDYVTKDFGTFLYVSDCADETKISKKNFKTQEAAQAFCEEHLKAIHQKLSKLLA